MTGSGVDCRVVVVVVAASVVFVCGECPGAGKKSHQESYGTTQAAPRHPCTMALEYARKMSHYGLPVDHVHGRLLQDEVGLRSAQRARWHASLCPCTAS
jgi:hypothetical protein